MISIGALSQNKQKKKARGKSRVEIKSLMTNG